MKPYSLTCLAFAGALIATSCSTSSKDTNNTSSGGSGASAGTGGSSAGSGGAGASAGSGGASAGTAGTGGTGGVVEEPDIPNTEDPLGLPLNLIPEGDEFIVAVIPDTQIYAQDFPETFDRHMKWLADRAEEYNIVFVSHVGDIVQRGSRTNEWDVAVASYQWLRDINLPHGLAIGSHDFSNPDSYTGPIAPCNDETGPSCKAQAYIEHFGAQHYENDSWYGGASPSGESSYQVISTGGLDLLFLHLMHDTPPAELDWANEVLDANPGKLVHLTTHRYMFDYRLTNVLPAPLSFLPAGRFSALTYSLGGQSPGPTTAEELFTEFIIKHPNIFAVHCGHVDAEFKQVDENEAGLPVHQTLVDFQDMTDGGGGWLRLLHFKPDEDEIAVYTLSTETGALRKNGDGFQHSLDILTWYKQAYSEDLENFGLTQEELDELLAEVSVPGEKRDEYFDSLYGEGKRDSRYKLQVDFQAYIDASM